MTLRLGFGVWFLVGVTAGGCGSDSDAASPNDPSVNGGGQTGEESVGCLPVERTPLAWSERSSLGFSADELLNALGRDRETRLTWEDGTNTTLRLELARGEGSVEFQARDWVSDNSGAEIGTAIGTECVDVVAIPVVLTFTTGDAAFAEEWPVTLLAESTQRATGFVSIDLDALEGNFAVAAVDPGEFDDVLAYLHFTLSSSWTGLLNGQAVKTTGSGPDGTSSATLFDIATF